MLQQSLYGSAVSLWHSSLSVAQQSPSLVQLNSQVELVNIRGHNWPQSQEHVLLQIYIQSVRPLELWGGPLNLDLTENIISPILESWV